MSSRGRPRCRPRCRPRRRRGRSPPSAAARASRALLGGSRAGVSRRRNRRARGVGVIGASTRGVPFERLVVRVRARPRAYHGVSRRGRCPCVPSSSRRSWAQQRPSPVPRNDSASSPCPPSPPRAARHRHRVLHRVVHVAGARVGIPRAPGDDRVAPHAVADQVQRHVVQQVVVATAHAAQARRGHRCRVRKREARARRSRRTGGRGFGMPSRRTTRESSRHSAMRSSAPRAASCLRSAARMRNLVPVRSVARPPRSLAPVERGVSNPPSPLSFESRKRPLPIERFPPRRTSFRRLAVPRIRDREVAEEHFGCGVWRTCFEA